MMIYNDGTRIENYSIFCNEKNEYPINLFAIAKESCKGWTMSSGLTVVAIDGIASMNQSIKQQSIQNEVQENKLLFFENVQ
jgi:hypothetical protein